jgi:hypothetical protein
MGYVFSRVHDPRLRHVITQLFRRNARVAVAALWMPSDLSEGQEYCSHCADTFSNSLSGGRNCRGYEEIRPYSQQTGKWSEHC